jgi:hypothetical protein
MGYACPVCSDPQADAGHLANHLAFTAILGDDDHEAWLDERAPGWADMGERELASTVSERVEEIEFPQLFEDTAGGLDAEPEESPAERSGALFGDHDHDHGHSHSTPSTDSSPEPADEETEQILEEARELTRRMLDDEEDASE